MGNPVGWFEIYVDDLERAKVFYEAVFGITLTRQETPGLQMCMFPLDHHGSGSSGALVKMAGVHAGGNSVLVYFTCEDCAVQAARAAQAGGRVQKDKFPIGPYGHIALVLDTEGNMIGLHSK